MITGRIGDLAADRRRKIKELKAQIQKWENDRMFSEEHKKQQVDPLKSQLASVNREFTEKINAAVTEAKVNAKKRIYAEPERDLLGEIRLLRQTIQTNELVAELVEEYTGANIDRKQKLFATAKEAVELNTPQAPAYIKALSKLMPKEPAVKELMQQYQDSQITPEQQKAKADLEAIEAKALGIESEILKERLDEGNLSPLESISIKGRLHEIYQQTGQA